MTFDAKLLVRFVENKKMLLRDGVLVALETFRFGGRGMHHRLIDDVGVASTGDARVYNAGRLAIL